MDEGPTPSARLTIGLLVAAALAASAWGCGGNGGNDSTAGQTDAMTKAQFLKRVNAICARQHLGVVRDSDAYTRHHRGSKMGVAELHFAAVVAVLPHRLRNDIRQIRALGPPPGEHRRIAEFFTAEERSIESGGDPTPTSIAEIAARFKRPDELAAAYGIGECGVVF